MNDQWWINMDCGNCMKRGWWCSRSYMHKGACALRPKWWNWSTDARRYRKFEKGIK